MKRILLLPFYFFVFTFFFNPIGAFSQDNDGDGWTVAAGDCNDYDNTVHPGAVELIDGQDNDCNGNLVSAEMDLDGDLYVAGLIDAGGWDGDPSIVGGGDCFDGNYIYMDYPGNLVYPGAPEHCGDGVDSNCDGIGGGGDMADEDLDGITLNEENALGTSDCNIDSDNDGIRDNYEDRDCDGVRDLTETYADRYNSDGDGLNDGIEDANHNGISGPGETDPLDPDTDGDGLFDGQEDADHDGVIDPTESNPLDADTDDDGIDDSDESGMSLNKLIADTDGDCLNDGQEIGRNTPISGGTSDGRSVAYSGTNMAVWLIDTNPSTKTDPLDADSDNLMRIMTMMELMMEVKTQTMMEYQILVKQIQRILILTTTN